MPPDNHRQTAGRIPKPEAKRLDTERTINPLSDPTEEQPVEERVTITLPRELVQFIDRVLGVESFMEGCTCSYCRVRATLRVALTRPPAVPPEAPVGDQRLMRLTRTRDDKEIREVYDGRPGPPCCVLTRSGKHQDDCPRIQLDALHEAAQNKDKETP